MTLVGVRGLRCYITMKGHLLRAEIAEKLPEFPSPEQMTQAIRDSAALEAQWVRRETAR